METILQHLKRYAILRGLVYIILGIAVLVNPSAVFNLVVYVTSGYIAFMGLLNLIEGIQLKRKTGIYESSFILGIMLLVLAAVILVFAKGIVSILPIFLGLLIVAIGGVRLIQAVNLKGYTNVNWVPFLIYSLLLLVGGILLIFNPFRSLLLLFQIFGGILIFMGISEFLTFFQLRNLND